MGIQDFKMIKNSHSILRYYLVVVEKYCLHKKCLLKHHNHTEWTRHSGKGSSTRVA
mgnify:CR=1 FL=1|jgi:hypothetical protein